MFKRILPTFVYVLCSSCVIASVALACVPGVEFIHDYTWGPTVPVSICVMPGGQGEHRAFAFPGMPVAAELRFPVLGNDWEVMPGQELGNSVDVFQGGPPAMCEGSLAGLVTDAAGWLTFPFCGGGYRGPAENTGLEIWIGVCPNQLLEFPEEVYFNSPDLNGDLAINLSDVPLFAADMLQSYHYRSDFNWDGAVNLSDLVVLAAALGEGCP